MDVNLPSSSDGRAIAPGILASVVKPEEVVGTSCI